MKEEFEPETFIELLKKDLLNMREKEKLKDYFIILKEFLGDIYLHSETSEKDRRKKPRDKLLFVEDNLDETERIIKKRLSKETFLELNKLIEYIKTRHNSPFGRKINFIWNSGRIKEWARQSLVMLKKLQKEILPGVHLYYFIDFD